MESFKGIFVIGICYSYLLNIPLVSSKEDYTSKSTTVHEMRDAIHQVGYNYPSWPSPEPSYEVPVQPTQTTPQSNEEVTTLDRYYRVEPDGTVEFKIALSDGQINYQKIYNKILHGRTIQVYDGYYRVRLGDGRYRTTYYKADEMGYRLLGFSVDTKPLEVDRRPHGKDYLE